MNARACIRRTTSTFSVMPAESSDQPGLVAVSEHGRRLAARVQGRLLPGEPRQALEQAWRECREIVFFGAAGIAVRLVAPLLQDKHSDPALVVVDDAARHVISLVAGHEGGANRLAESVGRQLGAEPVISTATEVLGRRDLVLGIGCSRGATAADIEALAKEALRQIPASFESVAEVVSVDLKADEPGLLEFVQRWHLPLRFFSAEELARVQTPNPSLTVEATVGTGSVAEAGALLAAGAQPGLIVEKRKSGNVTAAIARKTLPGVLSMVGIGPGGSGQLTHEALDALRQAEVIVGYTTYIDLVREWLPAANYEPLPIGQEIQRAARAIDLARDGRRVALVCSGDAGIYGLAGLVYEQLAGTDEFTVQVVPGITAGTSAAALLGAPLMADFATISLSDLLTPLDLILARLKAAAEADFVTVLYNPASRQRRQLLADAQHIFLDHRPATTPVGLVRNAYRPDQSVKLVELGSLPLDEVDMFTTLVIGNSQTVNLNGRMVTKRRILKHQA